MKRLLLTLIPLIALFPLTSRATHMSGGEIYYECLGNDQYRVTLIIYRDCAGVQLDPNFDVSFESPCDSFGVQVNTPNGVELSQLCDLDLPNSTCNGGSLPGIEQYSYSTIVTLPPCDFWTISWSLSNRNQAISNLVNPNNMQMWIQATLDNTVAVCDDSPQFTSIASPYVCLNYPVTYSLGAYDVNGDSLTYTLIQAAGAGYSQLAYVAPFTPTQPIAGLTLDPQTGLLSFTPTQAGNWVVVVQVNSYDSLGNFLGTVMRDMQFIAYPCSNVPPDASTGVVSNVSGTAVQTGSNTIAVCESGSFCFNMVITDANAANILDATTNLGNILPGATFSFSGTNPITCTVCWTGGPGTSGTYPFTVNVDDGACPIPAFQTYAYTINVIDGIFILAQSTNESCAGMLDGTASVTVTEGTAPYQYVWAGSPNTTASINVGAGNYTVQVSDANGCVSAPATVPVSTTQPPVANAGLNAVACLGSGPTLLSGNATNAYSTSWSGGNGQFTGVFPNTSYSPTAAEIASGSVNLILTAISNGACPADADTMTISYSNAFLNAGINGVDALCNATNSGSATFSPSSSQLSYTWNTAPVQNTATAINLGAGNYSVHVTDQLGCDTTMSVAITAPAALTISNLFVVNETCAGNADGIITASVVGGTAPYSYSWSNGATTATINVPAGSYTVQVTDANGCAPAQGTASVVAAGQPNVAQAGIDIIACQGSLPVGLQGSVVNAPSGYWSGAGQFFGTGLNVQYMPSAGELAVGVASVVLTTTGNTVCPADADTVQITLPNSFIGATIVMSPACNGGANGAASYQPAAPGLSYVWNTVPPQTTSSIINLPAGSYSVTVTDQYGCDTTLSTVVTAPPALVVSGMQIIEPTCFGSANGSATVTASGGSPGYTYQWSANTGSQTNATALGLGTGSYVVVVTDIHNCTAQATATLTAPSQVTLTAQVPDTVCVNAPTLLTAQAGGGSGNYTINWLGIGLGTSITYSFPTSQLVTVSATDIAGCNSPTVTLPVTVLDLSLANLDVYGDTIICPGGSASLSATLNGYPGPYTMSWPQIGMSGNGPFSVPVTGPMTINVIVADGCGAMLSEEVHLYLDVPPVVTLPPMIAEGCADLTVQFPDSLTNVPVTYLWNFGDGATSSTIAPVHIYTAGNWTVSLTVTTPAGCSTDAVNTGLVIAHAGPDAAFTPSTYSTDIDNSTISFTDGSTGGIVTYDWSFGDGESSDLSDPSHTYGDVGVFTVQLLVTNSFGCSDSAQLNVEITPNYDITIPNGFTPDPGGGNGGGYDPNDLSNNVFYPFLRFVDDFSMRIYNRWGELVFETDDLLRGWDGYYRGQLSPQDVYVYTINVRFIDGKVLERNGDITLFR